MFNPRAKLHAIGRFEGVRLIGVGGVGIVFEVRDPLLERHVALKLCKRPSPAARATLRREATLLAQLAHPNVVTIHEAGQHRGEPFYVMELVDGQSAHGYHHRCPNWRDAVALYLGAGLGLVAAHDRGIVHGDFKPANVLIGPDRRARVADFGLARALTRPNRSRTEPLGTLAFMAPERLRGGPGDSRADQFSFCVALWQLLYGARPFVGETRVELLESIEARTRVVGQRLPQIPRRLRALLDRGLAVDPDQRHASMHVLTGELADLHALAST